MKLTQRYFVLYYAVLVLTATAVQIVLAQQESAPVAIFTLAPSQPVINVPFHADASQSFDRPANGQIASYTWNWGDGTAAGSGVYVQHTYTAAGQYTITLTVKDQDHAPDFPNCPCSGSASQSVVISGATPPPDGGNHPPVAKLTLSPTGGDVGEEFEFDASGSSDPDSDPLQYWFDFGDGDNTGFITDPVVTHTYAAPHTYTIRLTVRDDSNASSEAAATVQVAGAPVDNQAPVALIAVGPRTGAAPVTLTFDGRISYDPDGDTISYHWLFTHGGASYAEQTGSVVHQLFSEQGGYSVVLEVTDSNGATDTSDEQAITITPPGESIEPPPPAPIPQPEPPPPSYLQRPTSACGIGLLTPMLACLMGLLGGRQLSQRRRQ